MPAEVSLFCFHFVCYWLLLVVVVVGGGLFVCLFVFPSFIIWRCLLLLFCLGVCLWGGGHV